MNLTDAQVQRLADFSTWADAQADALFNDETRQKESAGFEALSGVLSHLLAGQTTEPDYGQLLPADQITPFNDID